METEKSQGKQKKNLLMEAAQRKAAVQAAGHRPGILGKDLSGRFSSPRVGNSQRPATRGGRNGQGKP